MLHKIEKLLINLLHKRNKIIKEYISFNFAQLKCSNSFLVKPRCIFFFFSFVKTRCLKPLSHQCRLPKITFLIWRFIWLRLRVSNRYSAERNFSELRRTARNFSEWCSIARYCVVLREIKSLALAWKYNSLALVTLITLFILFHVHWTI